MANAEHGSMEPWRGSAGDRSSSKHGKLHTGAVDIDATTTNAMGPMAAVRTVAEYANTIRRQGTIITLLSIFSILLIISYGDPL